MNSFVAFIVIIIAYFGPIFLIPSSIKWASGSFAKFTGGAGKLGKMMSSKNNEWLNKKKGRTDWAQNKTEKDRNATIMARQRWAGTLAKMENPEKRAQRFRNRMALGPNSAKSISAAQDVVRQEEAKEAENIWATRTRGMDFPKEVKDATAIASAADNEQVTLNGQVVQNSAALRQIAMRRLVEGNKADSIREVKETLSTRGAQGATDWNMLSQPMAGKLLELGPDILKGDISKMATDPNIGTQFYADMQIGKAAAADDSTWRNMSARRFELQHRYGTTDQQDSDHEEMAKIDEIAKQSQRQGAGWRKDMSTEKDRHALAILEMGGQLTTVDANGIAVEADTLGRNHVDYAGRAPTRKIKDANGNDVIDPLTNRPRVENNPGYRPIA